MASTANVNFSQFWRLRGPRLRSQLIWFWFLVWSLFLDCRWSPSCWNLMWQRDHFSRVFFWEHEYQSCPTYLLKTSPPNTSPPNTITLEIRDATWGFWGTHSVHSTDTSIRERYLYFQYVESNYTKTKNQRLCGCINITGFPLANQITPGPWYYDLQCPHSSEPLKIIFKAF